MQENRRPPYQKPCRITTKDGEEYTAELYHMNEKYHTRVKDLDRWRVAKHHWIKASEVTAWEELKQ